MPVSDSTRRIFLVIGRAVWVALFTPLAIWLGGIAFDTQVKNGPNDQYWALFYGVVMGAIVFLAPFLVLIRGTIAFKTAAMAALALAIGATVFFSVKEYALSPIGITAASEAEHVLVSMPFSAVIFAIGAAICWALIALGRAVFTSSS